MTSELKARSDGRQALTIHAEWPEVAADYEDLVAEYSRLALPGFRPGKAPRAMIEQRFGQGIRNDLTARCARRLARQALRERGLRSAGPMAVVKVQCEPGRQFSFVAEFVPLQKLELPDYATVALAATIDHEQRDELSKWLLAHTDWEPPAALVREECDRSEAGAASPGGDAWQAAAQRVKLMVILEQIAETEGLEFGERAVDARIEKIAAGCGAQPVQLRQQLGLEGVGRLRSLLRAEQTLDFLLSSVSAAALVAKG